jgi:RNA recognition motif-containing protein
MNIGGNVIRISFSDSGKRKDIIGDESGYELNEKTCKLLHISLNKNSQVASESILKELFKKYGTVRAMHIKNNPGFRPTIYLEYSKPEEAENAINNLVLLDQTGEKRKLIGDPSCDINFYFKKKTVLMANDVINANMQPNIPSQNATRPMPMMPMMGQNMMQNPMSMI